MARMTTFFVVMCVVVAMHVDGAFPKRLLARNSKSGLVVERLGGKVKPIIPSPPLIPPLTAENSVDWRKKGAVTPVKQQGQCGSSYAFAATGAVEGAWAAAGNSLVSLSEQELVSCAPCNFGCDGGSVMGSLQWLLTSTNGTICSESSYPYSSVNGQAPSCPPSPFGTSAAVISNATYLQTNETLMAIELFRHGPIAVAVDASSWMTYTGGIVVDCISEQINHAALIVGVNFTSTPPYWILKNSWGAQWGEEGYIRVGFGSNQCLLSQQPIGVSVSSTPIPTSGPTAPTAVPSGVPPAPPAPPTPSPVPAGSFEQIVCSDSQCQMNCQTQVFPQAQCLQISGGGSAIVTCTGAGLQVQTFLFSQDCTGWPVTATEPINLCGMDEEGSFLMNLCPATSAHERPQTQGQLFHRFSKTFRRS